MKLAWKSYFGGVGSTLLVLFAIGVAGDHLRRMYGASVDALAGHVALKPEQRTRNFAAGDVEALAGEPMPAPSAPKAEALETVRAKRMATIHVTTGASAADELEKADAPSETSLTPAPTRSWFPKSFLFDPLVVTDAQGRASLDMPVPDRLTTWRILALAHSRAGAQAGAVASFLGTLPAYVDPVVPPFLVVGDEVHLPIQLVNTTAHAITLPLAVDAAGGVVSGGNATATVPAQGNRVQLADLRATAPGAISLHASFGNADAISRTIPVLPSGKPVSEVRGGTLAAPRTLSITGAPDLIAGSAQVRLRVYPGALGLLHSELVAAGSRSGAADDAYALMLSGRAPQLLHALGDVVDPEKIRDMSIVAAQRALHDARVPDVSTAAMLGQAALAHPDDPVLARLAERLIAQVAQAQLPDGSFEGGTGWTLQRLLVATAACAQAVGADRHDARAKERAENVLLRASGVFERNVDRVSDGYTAAAILASGALPDSLRERLRAKVREAVKVRPDGSRVLEVARQVVRADGTAPTEMEATALAVLALDGDPKASWRADLGSALLGSYAPGAGWGDGQTNLVALRAVLALFKAPMPKSVAITLSEDGQPIAHGELAGAQLRQTLALDAPLSAASGPHTFEVRASPPVAGLGFSLVMSGYVPWKPEPMNGGLELQVAVDPHGKVGQPVEVAVTANSPANTPLRIRQALPAGVEPDARSLDALVDDGTLSSYQIEPGAVVLQVPPRPANTPWHAQYRVIPTLAGTLHAEASTIEAADHPGTTFHLPPQAWAIR